jgi:hypothetical protein
MLVVIARSEATKQSILSLRGEMDCFATLAMTVTPGVSAIVQSSSAKADDPVFQSSCDRIERVKLFENLNLRRCHPGLMVRDARHCRAPHHEGIEDLILRSFANGSRECAPDDRLRDASRRMQPPD